MSSISRPDPPWKERLHEAIREAEAEDYVILVIAPSGRITYNTLDDYFRGIPPKGSGQMTASPAPAPDVTEASGSSP